ncbi:MAG: type VI secretion system baseplate subunit TssF [Pirellula sp.]
MDAVFLDHYDRELAYLREMGSEFAAKYPRLAGRLGLDEFQCSDPFVERLLEGFAFMSARIQRRLDAEFPQLTRSILDSIFPDYTRPIPSAGIFQLNPAHDEGSLIEGFLVPKGSRLHAEPAPGQQTGCRFDTVNDIHLWPIRVAHFGYLSRDTTSTLQMPRALFKSDIRGVLHLVLETTASVPFSALKMDQLRLHFRGGEIANQIYEVLIAHSNVFAITGGSNVRRPTVDSWSMMEQSQVAPVGFEPQAALTPGDCRSFSGYRLVQDYFILPEKFLFVDLHGLQHAISRIDGNQLHLVFGIAQVPGRLLERTSTEHVALHCVPAVNLFQRRADRIHLDHSQHEHQLVCDRSRPLDFEVWSVERMAAHRAASSLETACLPLYAPPTQTSNVPQSSLYYCLERRPRVQSDPNTRGARSAYAGTEVYIGLTDSHETIRRQDFQQLSSQVYCTNRDLPFLTPERGWRTAFRFEAAGPIANVLCLNGPTSPRPSLVTDDGETAWRLVSHLTPNYLTLTDSENGGAAMLRELLQLYCLPEHHSQLRQIEGLQHVKQRPVVRRIPMAGPITFARGLEIELQCDEEAFEGSGAFLLASVLEQFFARFVCLNSFAETHLISSKRGSIHRWPPRSGMIPLL